MYFSRIRIKPHAFNAETAESTLQDCYSIHQHLWQLFPKDDKRTFVYREEIARDQLSDMAGVRGEPVYYLVSETKPIMSHGLFEVAVKEYQPCLQEGDILQFDLRANPVVTRQGKKHDIAMDAQLNLLQLFCTELALQQELPIVPKKGDYKKILLVRGGEPLTRIMADYLQNDRRYAERLQYKMGQTEQLEWCMKAAIDTALTEWLVKKGKAHGFKFGFDRHEELQVQNSGYLWNTLARKKGGTKKHKTGFSSVDFSGELEVVDARQFASALFSGIGRAKAFGCGLMLVRRGR